MYRKHKQENGNKPFLKAERVAKYKGVNLREKYGFEDDEPMKIEDIPAFERKTGIAVNVFGAKVQNKKVHGVKEPIKSAKNFPIHKSVLPHGIPRVNMLYIEEGSNSHFYGSRISVDSAAQSRGIQVSIVSTVSAISGRKRNSRRKKQTARIMIPRL